MQITNEFKTRKINFIRIESVKEHYPSYHIQIGIETENIQTNLRNYIWLGETDIEKFLVDLETLDKDRAGQAVLESMTPGELELTFQAIDNLGHLSVMCHYKKEDRIAKDYSYEIKVEFQIDPTSLPTVRNEMLALIK
jgi:hypothetical protein